MELQGKWDINLILVCANPYELQRYLIQLKSIIQENLHEMDILIINKQRFLQRFFFLDGLNIVPAKTYKRDGSFQQDFPKQISIRGFVKLDDLDLDILELIRDDCRLSFEQIASSLHKSAQMIKYRMYRMIKQNVIAAFAPIIDYSKIGYEKHILFMELKGDLQRRRQLFLHIKGNVHAYDYMTSVNKWDLIVSIITKKDSPILDKINSDLLENFGDIFIDYEVLRVVNEPKYEFFLCHFKRFYKEEFKDSIKRLDFAGFTEHDVYLNKQLPFL